MSSFVNPLCECCWPAQVLSPEYAARGGAAAASAAAAAAAAAPSTPPPEQPEVQQAEQQQHQQPVQGAEEQISQQKVMRDAAPAFVPTLTCAQTVLQPIAPPCTASCMMTGCMMAVMGRHMREPAVQTA